MAWADCYGLWERSRSQRPTLCVMCISAISSKVEVSTEHALGLFLAGMARLGLVKNTLYARQTNIALIAS